MPQPGSSIDNLIYTGLESDLGAALAIAVLLVGVSLALMLLLRLVTRESADE